MSETPSRWKAGRVGSGWVELTRVDSSRVESSRVESSRVGSFHEWSLSNRRSGEVRCRELKCRERGGRTERERERERRYRVTEGKGGGNAATAATAAAVVAADERGGKRRKRWTKVMDLGEVQTRRSVRRENWLLCLHKHKPSSLLSRPSFSLLPSVPKSQKRSRLAPIGRTARCCSCTLRIPFEIPRHREIIFRYLCDHRSSSRRRAEVDRLVV